MGEILIMITLIVQFIYINIRLDKIENKMKSEDGLDGKEASGWGIKKSA